MKKKRRICLQGEMSGRDTTSLSCMICKETFSQLSSYRRHAATKHGIEKDDEEGWVCPYTSCRLSFPTFGQLSTHGLHAHRNDIMNDNGPVVCTQCECGMFPNQACYRSHKRKKHCVIETETDKQALAGSHEFQEGKNFPPQHKFGEVYFEKRGIYSELFAPTSFWSASTFITLGNLKDGGGGGGL